MIDQKIAKMRQEFYKKHKRTPRQLHIGANRIEELRNSIPDLQGITDEELFSDARVYAMKVVKRDDKPDMLGVGG